MSPRPVFRRCVSISLSWTHITTRAHMYWMNDSAGTKNEREPYSHGRLNECVALLSTHAQLHSCIVEPYVYIRTNVTYELDAECIEGRYDAKYYMYTSSTFARCEASSVSTRTKRYALLQCYALRLIPSSRWRFSIELHGESASPLLTQTLVVPHALAT